MYFTLSLTILDNVLTWDQAILVSFKLVGYEIDFAVLIRIDIHECAFGETITLPYFI